MFRGLTKNGQSYLAKKIANEEPIEFLKVDVGNGTVTGNPEGTTDLKSFKMSAKIKEIKQVDNAVTLTIQISNEEVEEGFYLKEIGIFVQDDSEEPILYWYANEENAQYINDKNESAIAFEIDIKMQVSNSESTILNWSGESTWVNKDYLEEKLREKEDRFTKKTAFNKDFGTTKGTVAEGDKINEANEQIKALAGGTVNAQYIQDSGQKHQGQFYIDRPTGRLFKCIQSTTSTNNATQYFEEHTIDRNVERLDNLCSLDGDKTVLKFGKIGILYGAKVTSVGNYIDVSEYFKSVKYAIFTGWINSNEANNRSIYYIYQETTQDLKVIYHSVTYNPKNKTFTQSKNDSIDDGGYYGSCSYAIIGVLKD